MKHVQSGSIMLIIICVMAALVILATNVIRNMGFMQDISIRYMMQEQRYRIHEALIKYALSNALNQLWADDHFISGQWEFTLSWPPLSPHTYTVKLHIHSYHDHIEVQSSLMEQDTIVHNLGGSITRAGQNFTQILRN